MEILERDIHRKKERNMKESEGEEKCDRQKKVHFVRRFPVFARSSFEWK